MNLPSRFLENLAEVIPTSEISEFTNTLHEEIPTSIRINPNKKINTTALEKIKWCELGYYLPERKKFTFDPLFHAGAYYVQEAGSMLIEQAFLQFANLKSPLKVLDLCASPGGKSTHILSLISDESILVSNEVIGSRVSSLHQNIVKWGNANCIITQNDPKDFSNFSEKFDIVVIDAPCSGEGMFRKHSHAIEEWSEDNVNLCSARQQRILHDAWSCLKENGLLIYSTCTYNLKENEGNISEFLKEKKGESLKLNLPADWNVRETIHQEIYAYRMMPHQTKSEGFFMSCIQKKDASESNSYKSKRNFLKSYFEWENYIKNAENFKAIDFKNKQFIFQNNEIYFLTSCLLQLNVKHFGVEIGELKGKDFIPSISLALSNHLDKNAFAIYEANDDEALSYLRKENIPPKSDNKAYELVCYESQPIGFIKNLINRTNNLYPKGWRVLSQS